MSNTNPNSQTISLKSGANLRKKILCVESKTLEYLLLRLVIRLFSQRKKENRKISVLLMPISSTLLI